LSARVEALEGAAAPLANPAPAAADNAKLGPALRAVAPGVPIDVWVPALNAAFAKYGLNTNKRIAAAIGQFMVESNESFSELREDMFYRSASRIAKIFARKFPTEAAAEPYVEKPEELGDFVYANEEGNGDVASGDGSRFRGGGLIQLTHRNEYAEFGTAVGMTAEEVAAYCGTPAGAAMSGCWYLATHGCLQLADSWAISRITRAVNGAAMLRNADRIAYANAILGQLDG
jgi:predicted chitinase